MNATFGASDGKAVQRFVPHLVVLVFIGLLFAIALIGNVGIIAFLLGGMLAAVRHPLVAGCAIVFGFSVRRQTVLLAGSVFISLALSAAEYRGPFRYITLDKTFLVLLVARFLAVLVIAYLANVVRLLLSGRDRPGLKPPAGAIGNSP